MDTVVISGMRDHLFQNAFKKWRWYLMKGRDRISSGEFYNSKSACREALKDNKTPGFSETEESGLPLEKRGRRNGNPPSEREIGLD